MGIIPLVTPEEIFDIVKAFKSVPGNLKNAAEYLGTLGKGKSESRWTIAFATAKKFGLLAQKDKAYGPTQKGHELLAHGFSAPEAKDLLRKACEKHEKFAEAIKLLNDQLQTRGSMAPTEIGKFLQIKYNPAWSKTTANMIGRYYSRWLDFFDLVDVSKGKIVPKGSAISEIEVPSKVGAEAGISIPAPKSAIPKFEVADVIFSLGRLDQLMGQKGLEETKKEIVEIKNKLQEIHPEAVVISDLLLDYLESHPKVDEYCSKMLSKVLELVRGRYFSES